MATLRSVTRYRLSDLDLDFVSLVAAGDDPEAMVVIAKAAPEGGDLYVPGAGEPVCSRKGCERKPVEGANGKCAMHAMQKSDKSESVGSSSPTLPRNDLPKGTHMPEISKADLAPEVREYIEGLETEVSTLSEQVEKAESDLQERDERIAKMAPADPEAAEKEMLEKADPALRSLIEKQNQAVREAQAIAKAERDARLDREFLAKAETLPMVAEDKTSFAGLLRRMAEALSAEDSAAVEKHFRAANEQIAQGNIFKSLGSGGAETTISKSLEAAATEIKKAHPDWSDEQAQAEAFAQNPDLFAQAMTGQEG